ncbi:heparan-alpha-glucosaminide N-acetyltransferase domain-containing protein [Terrimonas sp. NA20]|uniref:Heparan-alpha-glucosaminide N-acetyltransferase domain-containing protein n=1 Tax=Terrimonas ginsenosidimutans TaxID=2908004 RepID=A0ABS9KZ87_9BACT|nr:heparan-alpha-glucosaminide N-acetyltransferase domain-containing protein [Terrimonas ginsenosidimutans]MCG2617578.1 heparan-alpha-glucosaminide N-acetyltransferase domain-containing protein [Terrimonas ginsenosidimutans]
MQPSQDLTRQRIRSIDLLRGIIMIIMALDHVRDFFHQPAMITDPLNLDTTTPPIFFTRVITHFCAPVFVFLSGLSAYLVGLRKTKAELGHFLLKRGIWLIFVEIVIMSFVLTFNPNYNFILLGVIWAIGWSMIILGLLVRGSYALVLIVGFIIFVGHNILDYVQLPDGKVSFVFWRTLLTSPGTLLPVGGNHFFLVGYAILPWAAIMFLGYAMGKLYAKEFDPIRRRKILWQIGLGLITLFLLLRLPNLYGDPNKWETQSTTIYSVLSFFRVTKYPVSLQYACMTLGPALIFLAVSENWNNRFTRFATVYGSVPFFYYVVHFFLIHLVCMAVFFATGHSMAEAVDPNSLFVFRPVKFGFPLWIVYLFWMGIVLALYLPCKWYSDYKRRNRYWWLSYL